MRHLSICKPYLLAFLDAREDGLTREQLAERLGKYSRQAGGPLGDLQKSGLIRLRMVRRRNRRGYFVNVWSISATGREMAENLLKSKLAQMNGADNPRCRASSRPRSAGIARSDRESPKQKGK